MKKGLNFEYAMSKLQEITERLEDGNEDLESSLKLYEQGVELAKYCMDELSRAEQKIKIVETIKNEQDDEE